MIRRLDIHISDDACDLLQRMLYREPAKRLSLSQIQDHIWVTAGAEQKKADECFNAVTPTTDHFLGSLELPQQPAPLRAVTTT
jgi:serine/threonine protein kinase